MKALRLEAPPPVLGAGAEGALRVRFPHLLRLTFVGLLVGQLGRIPFIETGGRAAPLLLLDVLVGVAVVGGALSLLRRRRASLDRIAALGLVFAALGGASALVAAVEYGLTPVQLGVSLAYLGRWLLYFGVYAMAVNLLRARDVEPTWKALEGVALLFAGFGILQSLFLPGFAQIVHPGAHWDVQGRRLVSTFLDPNFAGGLLVMILLVVVARMAYGVREPVWKVALLAVAVVLTASRSSALALVVGLGVVLWIRPPSRKLALLGAAASLGLLMALPAVLDLAREFNKLSLDDPSMWARVVAWSQALRVLADNLFLGIGFNTYPYVQLRYGFDESIMHFGLDGGLLFIAVMTGLIGATLYAWLLGAGALRGARRARTPSLPPEARGLGLGTAAATVALTVHSLFLNSLLYTFLMLTLWTLWGLVHASAGFRDRSRTPAGGSREPE